MEYNLEQIRQRLRKENAEWANLFPSDSRGMWRLRERLRAIRDLLEERNAILRGKNNELLLTENGYQILRRMIELTQQNTIGKAAELVRAELDQTAPAGLGDVARKWIEHKIAAAIAKESRAREDAITDLEKRVEQLEKLHRHWLPWHRLPKGK